jgi:hypothetical protein
MDIDFQVLNAVNIFILFPITERADNWVSDNIQITDETQYWGQKGIVIEHGYIGSIMEGILNDDLTMEAAA